VTLKVGDWVSQNREIFPRIGQWTSGSGEVTENETLQAQRNSSRIVRHLKGMNRRSCGTQPSARREKAVSLRIEDYIVIATATANKHSLEKHSWQQTLFMRWNYAIMEDGVYFVTRTHFSPIELCDHRRQIKQRRLAN
jgi:hypothetical protein